MGYIVGFLGICHLILFSVCVVLEFVDLVVLGFCGFDVSLVFGLVRRVRDWYKTEFLQNLAIFGGLVSWGGFSWYLRDCRSGLVFVYLCLNFVSLAVWDVVFWLIFWFWVGIWCLCFGIRWDFMKFGSFWVWVLCDGFWIWLLFWSWLFACELIWRFLVLGIWLSLDVLFLVVVYNVAWCKWVCMDCQFG